MSQDNHKIYHKISTVLSKAENIVENRPEITPLDLLILTEMRSVEQQEISPREKLTEMEKLLKELVRLHFS